MKDTTRRGFLRGVTAAGIVATGVGITAKAATDDNESQVHRFLGTSPAKVVDPDESAESTYFTSDFSTWEEAYAAEESLIEDIQEEGSVLLLNDGALPLAYGSSVSLLGRSSVDLVYGGTGSGAITSSTVSNLREAMEGAGFSVNPMLWEFYENSGVTRSLDIWAGRETYSDAGEVPISDYTDEVISSYDSYNDAAIVTFSRYGGEGTDLHAGVGILDLQDDEIDVLEHAHEHFDKVIVIINSSNAMGLGNLAEHGVDACLWIGFPGQTGIDAVAEMLCGTRSPSGKLADVLASSSLSAPAMVNFGDYQYSNSPGGLADSLSTKTVLTDSSGAEHVLTNAYGYLVEPMGIYVGYRYYETRYEDCVLGRGNARGSAGCFNSGDSWCYASEVSFPFGFGLSYTTFEQTLDSVVVNSDDTATVTVTVRNTGGLSGKDVVEVYVQAPYEEGGIEKSAIQLCGFAKTGSLEAGESETLDIDVRFYDFASFDMAENQCWVLDGGTYYLAIGNGAHEALNNVLAAKGCTIADGMDAEGDASKVHPFDYGGRVWTEDPDSGYEVTSRFEKADLNHYAPGAVTYLARADWQGTWPVCMDDVEATDEMIEDLENDYSSLPTEETEVIYGADNGLTITDLIGVDYDDGDWDLLLDELTFDESVELVHRGASQTAPCASIGFPGTIDRDGPAGFGRCTYREDPTDSGTATGTYCAGSPSSVVIASTWNRDLAYRRGQAVGEDGYWSGTAGWWGPGANVHISPYSGRNFEYYSEDPYLGGRMAASDVAGAQSKGVRSFVKHFAGNDVETNRHGLSTFMNEQYLREIALKQFEFAVKEGGAYSLMKSYNRIGCQWVGDDAPLCTEVLHGEWGSVASVLSDCVLVTNENWSNERTGMAGGVDQWLGLGPSDISTFASEDVGLQVEIREACHRILHAASKTFAMNGLGPSSHVENVTAWWQWAIYGLTAMGAGAALVGLGVQVADEVRGGKGGEGAGGGEGSGTADDGEGAEGSGGGEEHDGSGGSEGAEGSGGREEHDGSGGGAPEGSEAPEEVGR